MIRRRTRKLEAGLMGVHRYNDVIDEPVKNLLLREIRSRYDDLFDTITVEGNTIKMHLDNDDATLKIEVRGTRCISTLCIPLRESNMEYNHEVRDFMDNTVDAVRKILRSVN